jgi:hypothetical protein
VYLMLVHRPCIMLPYGQAAKEINSAGWNSLWHESGFVII